MVLYDWKKILRYSGGSSKRILLILDILVHNRIPKNKWDPIYRYSYIDYSGSSFLCNPYMLLNNTHRWKPKEIADYVGLASFRSLGEYKVSKKLTLDLAHSPVSQDIILNNRLLRIEDSNIHFVYEDYTKENNKWQV